MLVFFRCLYNASLLAGLFFVLGSPMAESIRPRVFENVLVAFHNEASREIRAQAHALSRGGQLDMVHEPARQIIDAYFARLELDRL